jgi:hypothetical protein
MRAVGPVVDRPDGGNWGPLMSVHGLVPLPRTAVER